MRRLLAAVVGVALLYGGAVAAVGLLAQPAPGELVVVLGNAVVGGQPSPRLRARLDAALSVWKAGLARRVMVSGGVEPDGADEAAVMAAYLQAHGVPGAAIVQDPLGDDTFRTARHAAALLGPTGRAVVVTQWFHIARTELALRRFGVTDVSAAWPRFAEWRDWFSFMRELAGIPYYAVRKADATD